MVENSLTEEEDTVEKSSAHSFPKSNRLRKRSEYKCLFKYGKRIVGSYICVDYLFNKDKIGKLGITVSTRYGKAHERNRFKRCVRESYRTIHSLLPEALKINVIPRNRARFVKSTLIKEEMEKLLRDLKKI